MPEPFHRLMESVDSEIIDFYPTDFKIDLNGKKFAWQGNNKTTNLINCFVLNFIFFHLNIMNSSLKGVVLLPFIDEIRLLNAVNSVYPLLRDEEITRNTFGSEVLCFSNKHKLYDNLCTSLYSKRKIDDEKVISNDLNILFYLFIYCIINPSFF